MDDKLKEIARHIGYFYYEKENRNEEAAIKRIEDLKISNIEYLDDTIYYTF